MQRNFSADIQISTAHGKKNIVSIIPFSDSDKHIAKTLEKILNQSLEHDDIIDFDREDCFRRMTKEIR